jgi:hypothetical protein
MQTINKIKLSDKQKEVIRLMREGCEAAISRGFYSGAWLQMGKIGFGGKSYNVSSATLHALIDKKIIENNKTSKSLSTSHFSLTELGQKIII